MSSSRVGQVESDETVLTGSSTGRASVSRRRGRGLFVLAMFAPKDSQCVLRWRELSRPPAPSPHSSVVETWMGQMKRWNSLQCSSPSAANRRTVSRSAARHARCRLPRGWPSTRYCWPIFSTLFEPRDPVCQEHSIKLGLDSVLAPLRWPVPELSEEALELYLPGGTGHARSSENRPD